MTLISEELLFFLLDTTESDNLLLNVFEIEKPIKIELHNKNKCRTIAGISSSKTKKMISPITNPFFILGSKSNIKYHL